MLPGGYADALRALGRFLDSVGACQIGVVERDGDLYLSWSDHSPVRFERQLRPADVESLRQSARLYRGLVGRSQRFTISELLRTLGLILEELEATTMAITESADGFRLTAQIGEERTTAQYTYTELVERAQREHRRWTAPAG